MDLSIVIVSWNVRELLRACLLPLGPDGERSPPSREVIVVDNASSDGSAEMVRTEFPQVRLIVNDANRGFPAANNQGLAAASGRYVLLLNPDTAVQGGALTKMVAYADEHPDVGAIGPKLLDADGSV
ncbi:MAG: glycosyltransferase family 2 protein, partial [Anaerolineales bacterium]